MFFRRPKTKKCPKCAEEIKPEAVVCRHCGAQLDGSAGATAAPSASGFKARFTPEDWHVVMSVPFLFFAMTANADGQVDDAEAGEFHRRMQGGAFNYKSPLHREVAKEFFSNPVTPADLLSKANAAGPEKLRSTLRAKLSEDEYQDYLGSILLDAMAVAKASGGASPDEIAALSSLATFFGVDMSGLQKRFGG